MIDFRAILKPECVRAGDPSASKKSSLETAAELVARTAEHFNERHLLEELLERERLGSTALEDGIAIPHCRDPDCREPVAALLRLETPVDFEGSEVDILFVLVVPEEATRLHLDIIGTVVRNFVEGNNIEALRSAGSDLALYETFQNQMAETLAE